MASGMYISGVASMMSGDIDLLNDTISALLIDTDFYTPNLSTHTSQADIPEAAQIAELVLTGKTLDSTAFRADDAVFNSVVGSKVAAIVLIKDTEVYETSLLICFLDNAPEFPIVPDGTDITIKWDLGAEGIFKL